MIKLELNSYALQLNTTVVWLLLPLRHHNTNPLLQVVAFSIKTTPFGVVG